MDKQTQEIEFTVGKLAYLLQKVHEINGGKYRFNLSIAAQYPLNTLIKSLAGVFRCEVKRDLWEPELSNIMNDLPADGLPEHLNLKGQEKFMLGYYQEKGTLDNILACK